MGDPNDRMTVGEMMTAAREGLARGWFIRLSMTRTGATLTLYAPGGEECEPCPRLDEDDLPARLAALIAASNEAPDEEDEDDAID